MKLIVDNQIVRLLSSNSSKILNNPSLFNQENQVSFRWPSLLEYLGLGSILSDLDEFGPNEPVFEACIATLCTTDKTEVIFHLYDQLFAEILSQIKALPQINASFLLQAIKESREKIVSAEIKRMLSPTLEAYETAITEKVFHTMHDLILYLAWDRMCVYMARLFDHQTTDPNFIKGIGVLQACLVESYQHISQQGRTTPGIYRMLEAFLFYQMREENLDKLTAAEWTILSQSFQVLKEQEDLADFFYIDDAVVPENRLKSEEENIEYVTLDSPDRIKARFIFASCMTDKLKSEFSNWEYALHPKKVTHVEL